MRSYFAQQYLDFPPLKACGKQLDRKPIRSGLWGTVCLAEENSAGMATFTRDYLPY
jgi:hypothetical protein